MLSAVLAMIVAQLNAKWMAMLRHLLQVKSGNDDMRQDAVMQQFFALINNVLQESPDTQKRKLRIVTYKV